MTATAILRAARTVRREPHEPRVRRRAGDFRGAGLARDGGGAAANAASGAVEHHVAHEAAERSRGFGRQELVRARRRGRRLDPRVADDPIGGDRRHEPRHPKRRDDHVPLAVADLRQRVADARPGVVRRERDLGALRHVEKGPGAERHGELREVRVARHDQRAVQVDRPVRMPIHHVVPNRPRVAGHVRADTIAGQAAARERLRAGARVAPEGGSGGQELERRTGRIQAVPGAVQQGLDVHLLGIARGAEAGVGRPRIADAREHVAGRGIEHHGGRAA